MSVIAPLGTIDVGVVVERSKGSSPWTDHLWRPAAILTGVPDTPPWTELGKNDEKVSFYAGPATIELYRSETAHYRDNLLADPPMVWIALPAADADPPFGQPTVTVDPAEGEAWAGAPEVLVDTVTMPETIRDQVAAFVAEHHVEHAFNKRRRDRADPDALGRRAPRRATDKPERHR